MPSEEGESSGSKEPDVQDSSIELDVSDKGATGGQKEGSMELDVASKAKKEDGEGSMVLEGDAKDTTSLNGSAGAGQSSSGKVEGVGSNDGAEKEGSEGTSAGQPSSKSDSTVDDASKSVEKKSEKPDAERDEANELAEDIVEDVVDDDEEGRATDVGEEDEEEVGKEVGNEEVSSGSSSSSSSSSSTDSSDDEDGAGPQKKRSQRPVSLFAEEGDEEEEERREVEGQDQRSAGERRKSKEGDERDTSEAKRADMGSVGEPGEESAGVGKPSEQTVEMTLEGKNVVLQQKLLMLALLDVRLCQVDPGYKKSFMGKPPRPAPPPMATRKRASMTPKAQRRKPPADEDEESSGYISENARTKNQRRASVPGKKGKQAVPATPSLRATLTPVGKKCFDILKGLAGQEGGEWFSVPVDPVALGIPQYFDIIKTPMDFSTIERKLGGKEYETVAEFQADVLLTFDNAITFNPQGSAVHNCAIKLKRSFEGKIQGVPLQMRMDSSEVLKRRRNELSKLGTPLEPNQPRKERRIKRPERLGEVGGEASEDRVLLAQELQTLPEEAFEGIYDLLESCGEEIVNGEFDVQLLRAETCIEVQKFINSWKKKVPAPSSARAPPASKQPTGGKTVAQKKASLLEDDGKSSSTSSSSSSSESSSGGDSSDDEDSDGGSKEASKSGAEPEKKSEWDSLSFGKPMGASAPAERQDENVSQALQEYQLQGNSVERMKEARKEVEKSIQDKEKQEKQKEEEAKEAAMAREAERKKAEEEKEKREQEEVNRQRAAEKARREQEMSGEPSMSMDLDGDGSSASSSSSSSSSDSDEDDA
uniref:Bromo domain-containing protein n=1 Tax=Palpitomonas bilix TaxID=652834 RepID=A0A7S3G9I0_9EUKA